MSLYTAEREPFFRAEYRGRVQNSVPFEVMDGWVQGLAEQAGMDETLPRNSRYRTLWAFFNEFPQRVLYEDNDVILIDKPVNVLSHHADGGGFGVQEIAQYVKGRGVVVVNRLDGPTTGVIALARNEDAFAGFSPQFDHRGPGIHVAKKYVAILEGPMPQTMAFFVEVSLVDVGRKMKVVSPGTFESGMKSSVTRFKPMVDFEGGSTGKRTLVEVELGTGRTHQIRVVAAEHLGMPVVGDRLYGTPSNYDERLMLHSHSLVFTHPRSKKRISVSAPVPEDFLALIK